MKLAAAGKTVKAALDRYAAAARGEPVSDFSLAEKPGAGSRGVFASVDRDPSCHGFEDTVW